MDGTGECRADIDQDGTFVYIKWHIRPEAGIKTMTSDEATKLAGSAPDYHTQELFNAIESGDFPAYLVYIQVMTSGQAKHTSLDIFDDTYTWPHKDYPLRLVGRMTLNRNVRTTLLMLA